MAKRNSLFSFERAYLSRIYYCVCERRHDKVNILFRLVMMAEGTHPFPYRTRPLSPPAPMVLVPQGTGRVGRCQADDR